MPAFNREHLKEGLAPVQVSQIYYFATDKPNLLVDVTGYLDRKLEAILQHKSQVGMFGALARISGRAKDLGLKGSDYENGEVMIREMFEMLKKMVEERERVYEEFRVIGVGAGHLAERVWANPRAQVSVTDPSRRSWLR